jgi:hypothetical protein
MDYRIYFMSTDGHIQHALEIECESDEAAVEYVRTIDDGQSKELWQRARQVAQFPADRKEA